MIYFFQLGQTSKCSLPSLELQFSVAGLLLRSIGTCRHLYAFVVAGGRTIGSAPLFLLATLLLLWFAVVVGTWGHAGCLMIIHGHRSLRVSIRPHSLQAHLVLLTEVIRIRLQNGLRHLIPLSFHLLVANA